MIADVYSKLHTYMYYKILVHVFKIIDWFSYTYVHVHKEISYHISCKKYRTRDQTQPKTRADPN